jgi:hypothetical protein
MSQRPFTGPAGPIVEVVIVGTKPSPFSGMGSKVGDDGSLKSLYRGPLSPSESLTLLTRDSIDCVEGTRNLEGNGTSSLGDLGARYLCVFWTQKSKPARVFNL